MRKTTSLLLAIIMLISLTACSASSPPEAHDTAPSAAVTPSSVNSSSERGELSLAPSGAIYVKERIELPGTQANIRQSVLTGDKIFAYGIDCYDTQVFYLIDPTDCSVEVMPIEAENFYLLGQSYKNEQPVLTVNEDGDYLLSVYENGERTLQSVIRLPEQYAGDVITGLTLIPEHYILELSGELIATSRDCEIEKSLGSFFGSHICGITQDGHLVTALSPKPDNPAASPVTRISVLDFKLETLGSYETELLFDSFCSCALDSELLAAKNGIVYSYKYKSGEIEGLIDAASSGMSLNSLYYAPEAKYISFQKGIPAVWSVLSDEGLKILTLATYDLNYSLEQLIDMFNESSSDCKIKIIDYAAYNDVSASSAMTRLNADIVAGFTPDIYDLSRLNAQSFIRNGLLANMEEYFPQCGIEPESLVSGAYNSLKSEGGVYCMMPSFTLLSVVGNAEDIKGDTHLSSDAFFAMSTDMPAQSLLGTEMTRADFLRYTLLFNAGEYIDTDSKSCNLTKSGFGRYLELASRLPEETDNNTIDSQDISRAYAGEQRLILSSISGDLISYFSYYNTVFAGNAEFVGFPSDTSSGTAFIPSSLVGVSSASPYKEQAMELIAFLLSEYCQSSGAIKGLPMNKAALDGRINYWAAEYEKFDKALVSFYDGARVEISGSGTAEEIKNRIYAALDRGDTLAVLDDTLFELIYAECQAYFNAHTDLSQCLDALSSKLSIYLAEKY